MRDDDRWQPKADAEKLKRALERDTGDDAREGDR